MPKTAHILMVQPLLPWRPQRNLHLCLHSTPSNLAALVAKPDQSLKGPHAQHTTCDCQCLNAHGFDQTRGGQLNTCVMPGCRVIDTGLPTTSPFLNFIQLLNNCVSVVLYIRPHRALEKTMTVVVFHTLSHLPWDADESDRESDRERTRSQG